MLDPVYEAGYPALHEMVGHDKHDALHRWFNNYRCNPHVYLYADTWLTLEERRTTAGGRELVTYVGTIGADFSDHRTTVLFEVGAPPPPSFFRPAPQPRQPPKPVLPGEIEARRRRDREDMEYMRRVYYYGLGLPRYNGPPLPPPPPPRYRRNA